METDRASGDVAGPARSAERHDLGIVETISSDTAQDLVGRRAGGEWTLQDGIGIHFPVRACGALTADEATTPRSTAL